MGASAYRVRALMDPAKTLAGLENGTDDDRVRDVPRLDCGHDESRRVGGGQAVKSWLNLHWRGRDSNGVVAVICPGHCLSPSEPWWAAGWIRSSTTLFPLSAAPA
jgi:hypothetical protein